MISVHLMSIQKSKVIAHLPDTTRILILVKKLQSKIMIKSIHHIMTSLKFLKILTLHKLISQQKHSQAPINNLIPSIKISTKDKNTVIRLQKNMKT